MLGVVDPGDGGGDPLFEPGDGLVAFGQGAMGDEELADLTKKLSRNQLRQGQERAAAFSRRSASKPVPVK